MAGAFVRSSATRRVRRVLGHAGVVVATVVGGLLLVAAPAGAGTTITQPTGDIDITAAAGNVSITQATTVDAEGGNVNLTAPAGSVSVTGGSTVEASGNVNVTAGAGGSDFSNSTVTAGQNVDITGSGPFWQISGSNISAPHGSVTITDTGGLSMGGDQINAGSVLDGYVAVEVTVTGGCPGSLASMTAIEVMPVGATIGDEFWPFGTDCDQVDFGWGPPQYNPSEDITVGGGTQFTNQVLFGDQQGGVSHPSTGVPNVTLTYSPTLPLALITSPTGGTYSHGQAAPTSFTCLGTCTDSNGQSGPTGSLDTTTVGQQVYSVTAANGGFTDTASIGYSVVAPTPVITWDQPPPITYGTALSSFQLDANGNVPGTFTYSPQAGTVLGAGSQPLSVTFTPTDQTDYTTATGSVTLDVLPATPVVTWTPLAPIVAGTPLSSSQLDATANVPGTFTYSPPAGTVLEPGFQRLSVSFTPTDSIDYTTATTMETLIVKAIPVITWNPQSPIAYGTPLSSSQLDAYANAPGTFTYNPPLGTVLDAGNQMLSVTFTPSDSSDNTSTTATVALDVTPAPLTITASSNAEPYGLAIPAINPGYSGFVNGDGPGSLATAPACSTRATAGSPVGTYATTCSGAVDTNYIVNYVQGTMVITKAATTLTAAPISFLGSLLSVHVMFSATLTSNVTGAGVPSHSVTFTWATGQCTAQTNASGVATCSAFILNLVPLTLDPHYTASYDGAANYQATEASAGLKLA